MAAKGELIAYLREYINECRALQDAQGNVNAIQRKITELKTKPKLTFNSPDDSIVGDCIGAWLSWTFVWLLFVTVPLILILSIWLHPARWFYTLTGWAFADEHHFITNLLLALILATIIAIPTAIAVVRAEKKGNLRQLANYEAGLVDVPFKEMELSKAVALRNNIQLRVQRLEQQNMIPRDYLPYAGTLLRYLENCRADTLKEAINLLEMEQRENDRDEELRRHHREMQRQAEEQAAYLADMQADTASAADSARQAAGWSALSAGVTILEAERQRKRDQD